MTDADDNNDDDNIVMDDAFLALSKIKYWTRCFLYPHETVARLSFFMWLGGQQINIERTKSFSPALALSYHKHSPPFLRLPSVLAQCIQSGAIALIKPSMTIVPSRVVEY